MRRFSEACYLGLGAGVVVGGGSKSADTAKPKVTALLLVLNTPLCAVVRKVGFVSIVI